MDRLPGIRDENRGRIQKAEEDQDQEQEHETIDPTSLLRPFDRSAYHPSVHRAHIAHLGKKTNPQTKRTKKVGVTGKYGTRYGASLRKT